MTERNEPRLIFLKLRNDFEETFLRAPPLKTTVLFTSQ